MGVISDLNIVSLGDNKIELYKCDEISIEHIRNSLSNRKNYYYNNTWEIIRAFKGVWYFIEPSARLIGNYESEFFGLIYCKGRKYVAVEEKYKKLLENLIDFYLDNSSINKIAFLARLDNPKQKKLVGLITKKTFLKKLYSNKIEFDKFYLICL